MAERPRMILIAGPTASGKSALALDLAERLGGMIVNTDSMQAYGDLRVLTSRPSAGDEARVPHALYGHVDAAEAWSAGRFLADAQRIVLDARQPLIFVGGTGLYFEVLTKGLSAVPAIPETVRAYWRRRGVEEPAEMLHAELRARDPETADALRPSDPQRLVRALEVVDATGVSLRQWQALAGAPPIDPAASVRIVLSVDRAELRERIAARFGRMLEEGALDEVRRLAARGLDPNLPAMKAIGVNLLSSVIDNRIDLSAAAAQAITATRQYAKRQETWFRNRLGDWSHLSVEAARKLF